MPSTLGFEHDDGHGNAKEEPNDADVRCTQLSRRRGRGGPANVGQSGTMRPPSARSSSTRAAQSIRNLLESGSPSQRGRKKRCAESNGLANLQGSEVGMATSNVPELEVESIAEAIPDPAPNATPCPRRFYTTSSQLVGNSSSSVAELSSPEEAVDHPRPMTRSRSATSMFVNHHELAAALLQTGEAFSVEAEGSGFVIVPDMRSVNVGHAGPNVLPPARTPCAAGDPLAYLDDIWTSDPNCSNNGPLLNKYCLPEPNQSEEFARPNPQAYIPEGEDQAVGIDNLNCVESDAIDGDDEASRDDDPPIVNPPITISGEILVSSRVRVKLNCMEWGG